MSNSSTVIGLPFVSHVCQTSRPTIDAKEIIKNVYGNFYHSDRHNIMYNGCYKSMGYKYDLKEFLKSYIYKQNGEWIEVFAPNKTLLRKSVTGYISKILENK